MKKFLFLFMSFMLVACGPVMAGFEGLNNGNSLNIFNRINCGSGINCTRTGNGIFNMVASVSGSHISYAVAEYEVDATLAAAATIDFGMSLPDGAIVRGSYVYIEDAVVSADNNTLAITCDSAGDILGAINLSSSSAGDFVAGAVDGAFANNILLAAACVPEGLVGAGTSGITAGKIWLVVEYLQL